MKIRPFQPFTGEPGIPKPEGVVEPHVVTVQDGVPVRYPDCDGVGVRVVHPSNPKACTNTMGIVMFFLPPHASLPAGSHWTEETYCFLKGHGVMTLAGKPTEVINTLFTYRRGANTGWKIQAMSMEILLCSTTQSEFSVVSGWTFKQKSSSLLLLQDTVDWRMAA